MPTVHEALRALQSIVLLRTAQHLAFATIAANLADLGRWTSWPRVSAEPCIQWSATAAMKRLKPVLYSTWSGTMVLFTPSTRFHPQRFRVEFQWFLFLNVNPSRYRRAVTLKRNGEYTCWRLGSERARPRGVVSSPHAERREGGGPGPNQERGVGRDAYIGGTGREEKKSSEMGPRAKILPGARSGRQIRCPDPVKSTKGGGSMRAAGENVTF